MDVVIIVFLVLVILLVLMIPIVLFNTALARNSPFMWIVTKLFTMAEGNKTFQSSGGVLAESIAWCEENGEHRWITSEDGLKLHALYFPSGKNSGKYVIFCHGYKGKVQWSATFLLKILDMGYSVLAPDARAHGESEGKYVGMGWLERRDIVKWVEYLVEQDPNARIALGGISMGGATVMMTVGEDLPSNVVCAIEDCGYSSVWEEFAQQVKTMLLPVFPIMYVTEIMARVFAKYSLKEASAVNQLKKCKIPMLLIHGEADAFVPFRMYEEVCGAVSTEKQCMSFPGAGHGESYKSDPDRYWPAFKQFLDERL